MGCFIHRRSILAVFCGFIFSAGAPQLLEAATVYTDPAAFLASLQPGSYLETFDSLPESSALPAPLFFSLNGFSYTADTADEGFYTIGGSLSTPHQAFDIVLTPTSNNITALGGNFFLGGPVFDPMPLVLVTLDDGTMMSPLNPTSGFLGFTTTVPIASIVISAPRGGFAGVDDLIVGSAAVPEGSSAYLTELGLFGLLVIGCVRQNRSRRWERDRGAARHFDGVENGARAEMVPVFVCAETSKPCIISRLRRPKRRSGPARFNSSGN